MARQAPVGDPRLERASLDGDVRPVIALPPKALPNSLLITGAALLAVLLFAVLNGRRAQLDTPVRLGGEGPSIQAPTPLSIPPAAPRRPPSPPPAAQPRVIVRTLPAPPAQIVYVPSPESSAVAPRLQSASTEPALVVDATSSDGQGVPMGEGQGANPGGTEGRPQASASIGETGDRARATVFRNRATTVPQGSLIPAVLETALDSSRPGLARAVVSRDIRGFDGSRVLIPRGSRLIGEYQSTAAPGQSRALVNWIRLIRPDGATIAIGSPVSDALGRAGTQGVVDNHFFQRYGGAILQSVLDLGVNVATARAADGTGVVLGFPSGGALAAGPQPPTPTIRVKQGAAIAIFVARDLDFTSVETRR